MERCKGDVASGGALVNKTSYKARSIIATIAATSQQFRIHNSPQGKIYDLSTNLNLEVQVKGCVICSSVGCCLFWRT